MWRGRVVLLHQVSEKSGYAHNPTVRNLRATPPKKDPVKKDLFVKWHCTSVLANVNTQVNLGTVECEA